jgi:hypothetical protein
MCGRLCCVCCVACTGSSAVLWPPGILAARHIYLLPGIYTCCQAYVLAARHMHLLPGIYTCCQAYIYLLSGWTRNGGTLMPNGVLALGWALCEQSMQQQGLRAWPKRLCSKNGMGWTCDGVPDCIVVRRCHTDPLFQPYPVLGASDARV